MFTCSIDGLCRSAKILGAGAFLSITFFFGYVESVHAASYVTSPAAGTYAVGSTFTVAVSAASEAEALNAVSGTLSFPTTLLEVTAVTKIQSMVSLWVKEPTFSNVGGTVQFEGVVPNPGYTGTDGRILSVTFKVKAAGSAALTYTAGSILANDGNGTEILTSKSGATYTLTPATAAPAPAVTTETLPPAKPIDGVLTPQVTSMTHPDSTWSRLTTGTFTFVVPSTVTALRLLADDKPKTIPTVTYVPPITTRDIKDLPEGISFLHVQYKTAAGWGTVLHYKLQIDTTAPTTFTINEVTPGTFTFVSNDALSGILRYDIQIDGGAAQPFIDDGSHSFTIGQLAPGQHTILVRALDGALNATESTRSFTVVAPAAPMEPTPIPAPAEVVSDSLLLSKGAFAVAILSVVTPLIALVLLLLWLLHLAWRALGGIKRKIDREIVEARTAVHQSFVTMRTEFELDVELLRKASVKRKLTREESKILKHLQSTIDTAETAIAKEISDIENTNR